MVVDHRAGVTETGTFVERWKWSRPDVWVYTSLVQGLAASLRVSDALRIINNICQVGISPAEEVLSFTFLFLKSFSRLSMFNFVTIPPRTNSLLSKFHHPFVFLLFVVLN